MGKRNDCQIKFVYSLWRSLAFCTIYKYKCCAYHSIVDISISKITFDFHSVLNSSEILSLFCSSHFLIHFHIFLSVARFNCLWFSHVVSLYLSFVGVWSEKGSSNKSIRREGAYNRMCIFKQCEQCMCVCLLFLIIWPEILSVMLPHNFRNINNQWIR